MSVFPHFLLNHDSTISIRFDDVSGFVLKSEQDDSGVVYGVIALYESGKLFGQLLVYTTKNLEDAKRFMEKVNGPPLAKVIGDMKGDSEHETTPTDHQRNQGRRSQPAKS